MAQKSFSVKEPKNWLALQNSVVTPIAEKVQSCNRELFDIVWDKLNQDSFVSRRKPAPPSAVPLPRSFEAPFGTVSLSVGPQVGHPAVDSKS
jgi:hypothetical protein